MKRRDIKLTHPGHPVWNLLRLSVVGALLLAFLSLNYERLDSRDITTLLGVLAGLAGFDVLKSKTTTAPTGNNADSDASIDESRTS